LDMCVESVLPVPPGQGSILDEDNLFNLKLLIAATVALRRRIPFTQKVEESHLATDLAARGTAYKGVEFGCRGYLVTDVQILSGKSFSESYAG
jgi:hypothetical protein